MLEGAAQDLNVECDIVCTACLRSYFRLLVGFSGYKNVKALQHWGYYHNGQLMHLNVVIHVYKHVHHTGN